MEIMDYNVKAKVIDLNTNSDILKLRLYFDQLDEAHTINIKIPETANPDGYEVITSFLDPSSFDEYDYRPYDRLVESLNGGEPDDDLEIALAVEIENNDEIKALIYDYASAIYQCETNLRYDIENVFLKENIKSKAEFFLDGRQTGEEIAVVNYRDDYYLCSATNLHITQEYFDCVECWEPTYLHKITGDLDAFLDELNDAIDNNELDDFMSDHGDNGNLGYPELKDLKNSTSKEIECTLSVEPPIEALSL